jgi:Flp pilus assembly protein TadD
MSRMLDALRQHSGEPPRTEGLPARSSGASKDQVLASLGYSTRTAESGAMTPARRIVIGAILVASAAAAVWQVAAYNRIVSTSPLSLLPGQRQTASHRATIPPAQRPVASAGGAATSGPAAARIAVPASPRISDVASPVVAPPGAAPKLTATPVAQSPAVVPAPKPLPPQRAQPLQTEARSASASGITRNAAGLPVANNAQTADTDHFKLALYYQRTGDFEKALIHYRAVLEANELNAEAHNNLGLLYQDKGLFDEAIREFRRATAIDAHYDKAHNNLGVALLRSGDTESAVSEFRWIVAQDGSNVEGLTNLALALRASGRLSEARDHLQRALSINNRYANAHYNLALVLEESAEVARAIEHYEQFLALGGADTATLATDVRSRVQLLRSRLLK